MFDLNGAVAQWRNRMERHETLNPSDLDELESHLRDEMEHFSASRLTEEETFLIATHRIGDTGELAAEFAKVNTGRAWSHRLFWMAAGVLVYSLLESFAGAISQGALLLAALTGLTGYGLGAIALASKVAAFAGAVFFLAQPSVRQKCRLAFDDFMTRRGGQLVLCLGILGLLLVVAALRMFIVPLAATRSIDWEHYAHMAQSATVASMIWSAALMIALTVLLLCLHPLGLQRKEQ